MILSFEHREGLHDALNDVILLSHFTLEQNESKTHFYFNLA